MLTNLLGDSGYQVFNNDISQIHPIEVSMVKLSFKSGLLKDCLIKKTLERVKEQFPLEYKTAMHHHRSACKGKHSFHQFVNKPTF